MDEAISDGAPAEPSASAPAAPLPSPAPVTVRRHRVSTRLWHWTNALAVFLMLMSGLMIFNAHPRLYWGRYGANADHAWLEIGSAGDKGTLRVGAVTVATTGLLGYRRAADGAIDRRAFPGWATIPSTYDLAAARRWHFFFAWVLAIGLAAYWLTSFLNRHAWRDLVPRPGELGPRHLWREIKDHARLRFPTGEAALHYNTLQKLSYFGVLFVLLPLLVVTGLAMSPQMDAAWHWLLTIFGGRQSARSLHFIAAFLILGFILVHLLMVVLAGPVNEIRSMITGRYRLPRPKGEEG